MEQFRKALKQGQEIRKKQDEALALFTRRVQGMDDLGTLNEVIKQLKGEVK
ncbi:hypothetical protein [Halobacillus sp. A5]|uniref:hypothetical protein n=1 Tax=Halobacillus sp. A5 TaxID=2880263 RepID=UPI0020A687CE|nr:hypothetical protein [Halobacillus sp. A5]MCP3026897.1 hypothetical protein [Halobacillus sp. A5]